MKARKILVSLAALALVAAISIGGTLAYLTSQADVTNTFTVGNIKMTLTEKDIDGAEDARTDEGNEYKLYPGQTYVKDPTATILKGSEKCYVRMLVEVENIGQLKAAIPGNTAANGVFLLENLVENWHNNVWQYVNCTEGTKTVTVNGEQKKIETATYEFRYVKDGGVVDAMESAQTLEPLFTNITVPGTVDNDHLAMLGAVKINVTAQAMQQEGFTTADAAWTVFPNN